MFIFHFFFTLFTDDAESEVDSCDDSLTSTVRSALKVIPHIGSVKGQSKSVTLATKEITQSNQIFIKYEQISGDCNCNACAKKLWHNASLKRFHDAAAKGFENQSNILFTCHLCGAVSDNANKHMKEIHPDEEFQCEDCGKVFDEFENMGCHERFHKGKKKRNSPKLKKNQIKDSKRSKKQTQTGSFNSITTSTTIQPCYVCGRKLKSQSTLTRHMRTAHAMSVPPCDVCGKEFQNLALLKKHKFSVHSTEKPWKCEVCGKKFRWKKDTARHMRNVHSIPESNIKVMLVPPCDVSRKEFESAVHFIPNSNITAVPVPICDVCGKEFENLAQLKKHKFSAHTTEKPWKCEECGKKFRYKKDVVLCKHSSRIIVPEKYRCYVCGEELSNKRCLRDHLRMVHDLPKTQKFLCLICDEIFSRIQELRDHLLLHSAKSNESLKCKFCERYFNDPSSLRKHLQRHNNQTHRCEICGKDSMAIGDFRRHMAFHAQHISCHVCGRVMSSASKLKEHMNVHTGDKPIECDVCHKKLSSNSALRNHKNRVHSRNNRGMRCLICGKLFKTPFARNTHLFAKHTEEERKQHNVVIKMFTCHICGKMMRTEYKNSHLNKHSSQTKIEILYICEICGKGFIRHSLLAVHMMEHKMEQGDSFITQVEEKILETLQLNEELKHACDICGKKFRFVSSLTYHKKTHNTEKPHRCDVCGRHFKSKDGLKLHERKHFDIDPFTCEICGRKFQRQIQLHLHMASHSSLKAFSCPTCPAKFKYHKNMLRHIALVHNQERRFICDVCGKSFGTKVVLKVHYRKHTGEKPHSCDTCGRSFSDPSTLSKHLLLHKKRASSLLIASNTDQPSVPHYILEGEYQTETLVFY